MIIDRFCEMPRLRPWLPGNCPAVELMVRAEDREPAVAAASIIARSVYLEELQLLSARFGVPLSPGAGRRWTSLEKAWCQPAESRFW